MVGAAVGADRKAVLLDYDFDWPGLEVAGEFCRVTISSCSLQSVPGEARLPFRTAHIVIPPGYRVESAKVSVPTPPISLALDRPVEHGLVPWPRGRGGHSGAEPSVPPDLAIYRDPAPHPASRVQFLSVQRMEGQSVALLRLFPIQYFAAESRLEFARRLQVELVLAEAPGDRATMAPRGSTRRERESALAGEVGAGAGVRFQPAGPANPLARFDYLLVTKALLMPSFQALVDRKTADGLAVKTESMENILAAQPGRDSPEKLRNYIRFAYTNCGIRYVLLGGDLATVPCRYAYVSANQPEFDSYIPCDLYYSCLDGSWNSDGDNRWGEPTDGEDGGDVDLLGEVYVGRAPVDTPAEAAIWVAKTIRYEVEGNPNAGHARFLSTYLGFYAPGVHAQGGDMLDPLLPRFSRFTVDWLDDRPFTAPQWGGAGATAALNLSPHIAIYNGHGDVDWIMQLFPEDLDALTNRHPFLAYSVGCNAGEFDNDPFTPDCIGEQLLTRNSRGAFAAILNSRLGWFNPQNEEQFSGEFQTRFFDRLLVGGHTNLGVAHQLSKHDMIGHVEQTGVMTYRWCYYEINLLGDPHVALKPPYSGVTPQGTPHWWLAALGWTNNFEAAALADADGDGAPAWQEFVAGTSPVDALSVLRATCARPPGSGAVLRWPVTATRTYSVYRSTNLAPASFTLLTNMLAATWPTNSFIDATAPVGQAFYRIEAQAAP